MLWTSGELRKFVTSVTNVKKLDLFQSGRKKILSRPFVARGHSFSGSIFAPSSPRLLFQRVVARMGVPARVVNRALHGSANHLIRLLMLPCFVLAAMIAAVHQGILRHPGAGEWYPRPGQPVEGMLGRIWSSCGRRL